MAEALRLRTRVTPLEIIARLRRAQEANANLSKEQAERYYRVLADAVQESADEIEPIKSEALIYFPGDDRKWWTADLCLMSNRRDIFGSRRAYLGHLRQLRPLWDFLGIEDEPSVENLLRYWGEVAAAGDPDVRELSRLQTSYQYAERSVKDREDRASLMVWTDKGWMPSTSVAACHDEVLWTSLGDPSVPTWLQDWPAAFKSFCRWSGITLVEDSIKLGVQHDTGQRDEGDEASLKEGLRLCAAYLRTVEPALHKKVRGLLRDAAKLEVRRVPTLEVPASINLPGVGLREARISRAALRQDGNLLLAALTDIGSEDTVEAVVSSNELTQPELLRIRDALRIRLIDAQGGVTRHALGLDILEDDGDEEEYEFVPYVRDGRRHDWMVNPDTTPAVDRQPPEAVADVIPVDSYEVDSHVVGDGGASGSQLRRLKVELRKPGRPPGPSGRKETIPRKKPQDVEQRGLDLFVESVLNPSGIRVTDQRLRSRVGADLLCSDGFFRELKTSSGAAPERLSLTLHERARAAAAADKYELVIIENVFGERPTITMIPDPINSLNSEPTGTIVVTDWKEKAKHFSVIRLRAADS